jgi:competence protein ComEC
VAIISVGRKNKYGHPNEEVIERLTSLGIPIRRTDEEGTITYETYFGAKLGRVSS